MKNIICWILIVCSGTYMLQAQTTKEDSVMHVELYKAYTNLRKMNSSELQKEGFQTYLNYASDGYPEAMDQVAYCYWNGIGTMTDKEKSILWYKKAAKKNYAHSIMNLALIYKKPPYFSESYEYASKIADMDYREGHFLKGYLLYQGLGCKQDYFTALAEFEKGILQKDRGCLYMAGICYRNGYGTKRNQEKATSLLLQSKKSGHIGALEELITEEPENPIIPILLTENEVINSQNLFTVPYVTHAPLPSQESTTYHGSLITYDWSGKYLLNVTPLSVQLNIDNDRITGQWIENNGDISIPIEGIQNDSCILFNNTSYDKTVRESYGTKIKWTFNDARLNAYHIGETQFISGNIRLFAPEYGEYGRPMYLLLSNGTTTTDNEKPETMIVFPNPFETEITICVETVAPTEINISIHTLTGFPVYRKTTKALSEGKHYYKLNTPFESGQYIVKVEYDGKCLSYPVQKK